MYTQQSHFYAFLMSVKMLVPHKNMDTKVCDIGQNQCASTTEWTQYVAHAHNRGLLMRETNTESQSSGESH